MPDSNQMFGKSNGDTPNFLHIKLENNKFTFILKHSKCLLKHVTNGFFYFSKLHKIWQLVHRVFILLLKEHEHYWRWAVLLVYWTSDPIIEAHNFKIHSCPKLKLRPVLPFSSFVQNSSINEYKNTKLRENICFEIINWILYYWGFRNNLQMNTNDFF